MSDHTRVQFLDLKNRLAASDPTSWAATEAWIAAAQPVVREYFPGHVDDFKRVTATPRWVDVPFFSSGGGRYGQPARNNLAQAEATEARENSKLARDAHARISAFLGSLIALLGADVDEKPASESDPLRTLLDVLDRFRHVVDRLAPRPRGRAPLQIEDEYDVQYVLDALLALHFDDVRPEEWTPSDAGGASRMDFLLKPERIVIETKFVREGHTDKAIADELIIDKERYAKHPDCGTLVCFVYDPHRRLRNPTALANDLTQESGPKTIVVVGR